MLGRVYNNKALIDITGEDCLTLTGGGLSTPRRFDTNAFWENFESLIASMAVWCWAAARASDGGGTVETIQQQQKQYFKAKVTTSLTQYIEL